MGRPADHNEDDELSPESLIAAAETANKAMRDVASPTTTTTTTAMESKPAAGLTKGDDEELGSILASVPPSALTREDNVQRSTPGAFLARNNHDENPELMNEQSQQNAPPIRAILVEDEDTTTAANDSSELNAVLVKATPMEEDPKTTTSRKGILVGVAIGIAVSFVLALGAALWYLDGKRNDGESEFHKRYKVLEPFDLITHHAVSLGFQQPNNQLCELNDHNEEANVVHLVIGCSETLPILFAPATNLGWNQSDGSEIDAFCTRTSSTTRRCSVQRRSDENGKKPVVVVFSCGSHSDSALFAFATLESVLSTCPVKEEESKDEPFLSYMTFGRLCLPEQRRPSYEPALSNQTCLSGYVEARKKVPYCLEEGTLEGCRSIDGACRYTTTEMHFSDEMNEATCASTEIAANGEKFRETVRELTAKSFYDQEKAIAAAASESLSGTTAVVADGTSQSNDDIF